MIIDLLANRKKEVMIWKDKFFRREKNEVYDVADTNWQNQTKVGIFLLKLNQYSPE